MAEMAMDAVTPGVVPAGDETTQRLTAMWRELLGLDAVGPDENYFDLGGDSALAVHLFARIEKEFGVKLPLATLFEAQTVAELTEVLRGKAQPAGWSPLVSVQPNGSRANFFCVHGAGGNVFIYRDLAKLLGPDQPFYGLQSRGLDGKEELQTSVPDMARIYVDAVQRVQPHGPYFLGGYCMGGTVAYEMAQQLSEKGEQVGIVALFDTADWSQVNMYSKWARAGYQAERLWFHLRNFLLLDAGDKAKFFREKWKVLESRTTIWKGIIAGKLKSEGKKESESALLARVWENNDRCSADYVPRPLNAPIVNFRPKGQYTVFRRSSWTQLALKGEKVVGLKVYPAGMLLEPFVQELATSLRRSLDDAGASLPRS
jgi:phthiocerol/phenolphthiocerol synthesis type-I polyketide synthase E